MPRKKTKKVTKKNKKHKKSIKINEDLKILLLVGSTILFGISIYTNLAGVLSFFTQKYIYGLFGIYTYIVPILILYILSEKAFFSDDKDSKKRIIGMFCITISASLLLGAVFINSNLHLGYDKMWQALITFNADKVHAGIVGYLITYAIAKLIGLLGSYIVYFIGITIGTLYVFDISLKNIISFINRKIERIRENREKVIESKKIANTKNVKAKETVALAEDDEERIIDIVIKDEKKENSNLINSLKEDDNYVSAEQTSFELSEIEKEETSKEINDTLSEPIVKKPYIFPTTDLLNLNPKSNQSTEDKQSLLKNAEKLESTLSSFGVQAKVLKVTKGPSVTRFELAPNPGVKVSRIVSLQDDIALGLAANGVRMEAPIPGKAAIGIEVPNLSQTPVFLREVFETNEFSDTRANLAFAVGEDITGKCVVGDLSKMPHMLIAGATGSGKSVCINTLIVSLLYKYSPDDVKLLMVDPKVVELSVYNGIPHLLIPVVTDPKKAAGALNWAVNEMNRRYNLFSTLKVKNIDSYNNLSARDDSVDKLPYIVIIIDELADLMMACPNDIEDYICRLAQMARAAGMHIIIATQRPSTDVITGVIKANIPSRISFAVSSGIDSRTILDSIGAEKLLGRGDMLYYPSGESKPVRIQGAFISEEEVERIVESIKISDEETSYEQEILTHIDNNQPTGGKGKAKSNEEIDSTNRDDDLLEEAIKVVVQYQQASTSFLQRKLRVGFNRASRLMDELEEREVISKRDGSKAREVLLREYMQS